MEVELFAAEVAAGQDLWEGAWMIRTRFPGSLEALDCFHGLAGQMPIKLYECS